MLFTAMTNFIDVANTVSKGETSRQQVRLNSNISLYDDDYFRKHAPKSSCSSNENNYYEIAMWFAGIIVQNFGTKF